MECNKDEAINCKHIAEEKLKEKDTAAAKQFALKAESLCPTLEELPQLLKVINFFDGYEKKINGEVNWYAILGVDPLADRDTLRKAHKRMSVVLHPDKNKTFGAEEAFKMLSQARSVLFEEGNKLIYDMKLNYRGHQRVFCGNPSSPADKVFFGNFTNMPTSGNDKNIPMPSRNMATTACLHYNPQLWQRYMSTANSSQSMPTHQTAAHSQYVPSPPWPMDQTTARNAWHNTQAAANFCYVNVGNHQNLVGPTNFQGFAAPSIATNQAPNGHQQNTPVGSSMPAQSSQPLRPETFWTSCNKCRILYEFLKVYLDRTLMCPKCRVPFLATEKSAPPPATIRRSRFPGSFHNQMPGSSAASVSSKTETTSAKRATEAAQNVQSIGESLKREGKDATSVTVSEEVRQRSSNAPVKADIPSASQSPLKKRRVDGQKGSNGRERNQMAKGSTAAHMNLSGNLKGDMRAAGVTSSSNQSSAKELSALELRTLLMGKAKTDILGRFKRGSIGASLRSANKKCRNTETEKVSAANDSKIHTKKSAGSSKTSQQQTSSMGDGSRELNADAEETVLMSVPDANFYDFDQDRVETSFHKNQVWALYDEDDGMPRYYALIQEVVSRKPFKVQISWLNSKSISEFGSTSNWVSCGFVKTSGFFRVGKPKVHTALSSFSHQVKWRKGARGAVQIFPARGDVWAQYKNWSTDWNEFTEDDVIHKYEVVVVVEDYNEDKGVVVSPLVKVAGYTSVFRQQLDHIELRTVPREEMFRFSHQIPSRALTGSEAQDIPTGSWELDPASLPLELLRTVVKPEEPPKEANNTVQLDQTDDNTGKTNEEEGGAPENVKPASMGQILTYSRRRKLQKAGDVDTK